MQKSDERKKEILKKFEKYYTDIEAIKPQTDFTREERMAIGVCRILVNESFDPDFDGRLAIISKLAEFLNENSEETRGMSEECFKACITGLAGCLFLMRNSSL